MPLRRIATFRDETCIPLRPRSSNTNAGCITYQKSLSHTHSTDLSTKIYFFVDFFFPPILKPASKRESKSCSFFFVFFGLTAPPPVDDDASFSFPSSSYPLSDGKQADGSVTSGCFEVTCSIRRGGFAFTMKVWRQMVHIKALESCFALAAAAFRSSSDLPIFF